jgi:hypothetical protein
MGVPRQTVAAAPALPQLSEIARRLRRLFAAWHLAPQIEESAERFTAELDVHSREIAGGPYIIDRRPNHPPHTLTSAVPGPRGFELEVSMLPMLPQIMTQYAPQWSPRGGLLQQFDNTSPGGELLSTSLWFTPDAGGQGPFLVVELQTGRDVPPDFANAVLDQIAPVTR